MAIPVNPYVAGNHIGYSTAFVGRADVLREVMRVLCRPYMTGLLRRAGGRFTTADRRFITKVAGGHPYLLQVAAFEL
jgi:hypothetical protein